MPGGGNHRHLAMNQIGRHRRQPVGIAFRPAVFDAHVLAVNKTSFAQPFEKRRQTIRESPGGRGVEKADFRHRLLRMRDKRARQRSASQAHAEKEFASSHPSGLRPVHSSRNGDDQIRKLTRTEWGCGTVLLYCDHSICGILALTIRSLKNGTFLAMRSRTASGPAAIGA